MQADSEAAEAATVEYFPARQEVHDGAATIEYVPPVHAMHVAASLAANAVE
jgi:hypothetical protein